MTPEEAARTVTRELVQQTDWNYDTLEVKVLVVVANAFERFAELLSTPVSEGGPGEG